MSKCSGEQVDPLDPFSLTLNRLGPERPAGLWQASLPWPVRPVAPCGLGDRPTYAKGLGQWPQADAGVPRRLLMAADAAGSAPECIRLGEPTPATADPPTADMHCFEWSPDRAFLWERHLLRISWGDRTAGLALGLRTDDEVHWWEACRAIVEEETPFCRVVRMGGAIPLVLTDRASLEEHDGYYANPLLHRHNWLNGDLLVRLYANGVCEIFARHVNARFVDDGLDLEDAVPVIGIQSDVPADAAAAALGPVWDGTLPSFEIGGVQCDVEEAARLATPEKPGRMDAADGMLVWQPYLGVEVYGGACPRAKTGDPWVFHAENRLFPRGMARTIRFSLSLSDRPPTIVRYQAPPWWYGLNQEFLPRAFFPVSNAYDDVLNTCQTWLHHAAVCGGFEDGAVPRSAPPTSDPASGERHEAGWEGDMPYAQFLLAYRTGDDKDYASALRSAYCFTDVAVDHAAKQVRMHGWPPVAFAQPMNRVLGTIAAYLETGDPYLLDTAEAVVEASYRAHLNSWPRFAVGRDACYGRGAAMLYRYFGNTHFQRVARDCAMSVVHTQRENGSFGDQGGGAGIHQWGGYITKPWMGLLATNCVLDYLELFPDETAMVDCVLKFGDWLMDVRWERDGFTGWSYQHDFDGQPDFYQCGSRQWVTLPAPGQWHHDTLARVLAFCAQQRGDGSFLDAWAESLAHQPQYTGDHPVSAALQFVPGVQAHLWHAEPTPEGIRVQPFWFGPRTPRSGRLLTPIGEVECRWAEDGRVVAPDGVRVVTTVPGDLPDQRA